METIHIFHTNDVHSHFESWPQTSRFLQNKRKACEKRKEAYFQFDIGDHVDRSHPFTEGTNGKGNITLLNQAGYDAITIGNNEGITMSKDALMTLYDEAKFDVILGNLTEEDGEIPAWAIPYKIYETTYGTKVGVIGATAEYQQFYTSLGWTIYPPRRQLATLAQKLATKTDVLICLSHMGVHEDRLLAEESTQIDVILGAHTHHLFPKGEMVNGTLLAATGKFGNYIGCVTILYDENKNAIVNKNASLIPTDTLAVDKEDAKQFAMLLEAGKEAMEEKLFYNRTYLKHHLFAQGPLSSLFGRALMDFTNADCALFNTGIFLGSLKEGWITRKDIHALLPHPINVCVIKLTGKELKQVYEQSLNETLAKTEVTGLGFRGSIMGTFIHERLFQNSRGVLFVGNEEVCEKKIYRLATLDMFTFGFFFPLLQHAEKTYYMPELIRDVFASYNQKIEVINDSSKA